MVWSFKKDDPKKLMQATRKIKTLVSIFGLIFTVGAFICLMVAFSTPNWIEHFNKHRDRQFNKMGLWEACFKGWSYYKDYLGKRYHGCWWIFSFELRPVWTWLNPPWFLGIQVMITVALLMEMITILFMILYFIKCCPVARECCYVTVCCILSFLSGTLIAISTILFGVKADTDRQWLPHPDSNFLSWSFGFCVLSGFFCLFAGLCLIVEALKLNAANTNHNRREAYALKPVPRY